jgi:hypothetical protein
VSGAGRAHRRVAGPRRRRGALGATDIPRQWVRTSSLVLRFAIQFVAWRWGGGSGCARGEDGDVSDWSVGCAVVLAEGRRWRAEQAI